MPEAGAAAGLPGRAEIVIPVHNRREVTLRCLAALQAQGLPDWAGIIVVDDGSTDGTAEAIGARFPAVTVLPGSGQLWWTGAIAAGMQCALDRGAELIFWLNDDCLPAPGALELLARHAGRREAVAVGQAFTPSGFRYGAFLQTATGLRAIQAGPGEVLACDTFCGNCVCFPRAFVAAEGLPDAGHFPQNHGDSDYGLRLHRRGRRIEVLGDAICGNDDNHTLAAKSWLLSPEPMWRMLKGFGSPKSTLYVSGYFHYTRRHWGSPWGLVLFVLPYLKFLFYCLIRLVVPRPWLLALVGGRSSAWKRESFKTS